MKDLDAQGIAIIIGAIVAGFGAIAGLFFKQMNKQETRSNKIIAGFMKAVDENTDSNREIAKATVRSADEAKERNGHLAELTLGNKQFVEKALNQMSIKVKGKELEIEN